MFSNFDDLTVEQGKKQRPKAFRAQTLVLGGRQALPRA
jgi:hypothetical protein